MAAGSNLLAWGMPVGPLMANAFLVGDEASREAVVIDPGQEPEPFLRRVGEEGWRVVAVLVTHAHFDHIGGSAAVLLATHAPLFVPAAERDWLFDPLRNQSAALAVPGLPAVRLDPRLDIRTAQAGDRWSLGGEAVLALGTPGHTPDGLSYHVPRLGDGGAVFTGDTLFAGTIGRTDRHGGNAEQLIDSVRRVLLALPGETVVLPGHGRSTTVEEERLFNPYLA